MSFWKKFCRHPLVKFLASLKLAVIVILSSIAFMTWGTIVESLHGTEYAQTLVYFSPYFRVVMIFLFLNILFATLVRLPYRKRLFGFYIIHAGLLTIMIGALMTEMFGIDGNIELYPNKESSYALLNSPHLHFNWSLGEQKTNIRLELPRSVRPLENSEKMVFETKEWQLILKKYYPYAKDSYTWEKNPETWPKSQILWISLNNAKANQEVKLSSFLYDQSFQSLGPLSLRLFQATSSDCLLKHLKSEKHRYLYASKNQCLPVSDLKSYTNSKKQVKVKTEFEKPIRKVNVLDHDEMFSFYPDLTAFPIAGKTELVDQPSSYLFDLNVLRKRAHVLFFGNNEFLYGKGTDWTKKSVNTFDETTLPWMNLKLTITRQLRDQHQQRHWSFAKPQSSSQSEQRVFRAAELIMKSKLHSGTQRFWVDNVSTQNIPVSNDENLQVRIGPEVLELPLGITLKKFHMDKNPGTNDPASFKSYVSVKEGSDSFESEIFMNNPLKRQGYTFYQASYFPLSQGGYGSVLSVNKDPGRWVKYIGSLLLVLGSIIHFGFIKRKKTPKQPAPA